MLNKNDDVNYGKGKGIDKVMRWILFSILLVVIPPLFVILYRLIVGLDFSYNEYAPDVMTTSVALCCNFLSLCFDDGAKINQFLKLHPKRI